MDNVDSALLTLRLKLRKMKTDEVCNDGIMIRTLDSMVSEQGKHRQG